MPGCGDEQHVVPGSGELGGWVCGSPGRGPDAAGAGQVVGRMVGTVLGAGGTSRKAGQAVPAEEGVGPPPHLTTKSS